ncbi:uncharacterized protein LOC135840641 [Planococcus citri]|uniref:uncharacterized protein LOC135840641 n=1 Tax=Planococcus citri TaxID=170843 RepID=UPI0031F8496E
MKYVASTKYFIFVISNSDTKVEDHFKHTQITVRELPFRIRFGESSRWVNSELFRRWSLSCCGKLIGEFFVVPCSRDEFRVLKTDLLNLKEKISSIELRIKLIENKTNASKNHVILPELHSYVKSACCLENDTNAAVYNVENSPTSAFAPQQQDLDKKTRNIIEELMWESTLSKAVLQVRENFKDGYSREMFLRYSFELVLEKDEQYRKMIGTLFGHLLTQNVINQTNIFNSLCSVLMVIENSSNYNTQMWQNLSEILLPIILESHIKLFQLQRKAQAILKQEYYREFINYLVTSIEENKKQKLKPDSNRAPVINHVSHTVPLIPSNVEIIRTKSAEDTRNNTKMNFVNAMQADYVDPTNLYDDDRYSKCKMSMDADAAEKENCRHDLENILQDFLDDDNMDNAARRIEKLHINYDVKTIIEELIYLGFERESEYRLAIGALLIRIVSCGLTDFKRILATVSNHARSVEKLILNPNTRASICATFADILSPLIAAGKIDLNQLTIVASTILPEETKTIFLFVVEKILTDRNLTTISHPVKPQSNLFNDKVLKRLQKYYLEKGERLEPTNGPVTNGGAGAGTGANEYNIPKPRKPPGLVRFDPPKNDPVIEKQEKPQNTAESAEHDNFLMLKRKKLLKERIENTGDKSDIKIEDLIADQTTKKNPEAEAGDGQGKIADPAKTEADLPPIKQPENLPSSAIKEKMEEIIEHLMDTGNMDECIATIRDTFNECQTDLVFKAAFEYTKGKESGYRTQSGTLIAEAFKHDPKRVGAQIMNTISLELGDFVDSPDLWQGMAEIICPSMLFGLIRFHDLKLLPKYFKHTPYCASLLSALFGEILRHKGPEWLEESWKRSKVDLTAFLPSELVSKFIADNNLNFMFKDGQSTHYKENASET